MTTNMSLNHLFGFMNNMKRCKKFPKRRPTIRYLELIPRVFLVEKRKLLSHGFIMKQNIK